MATLFSLHICPSPMIVLLHLLSLTAAALFPRADAAALQDVCRQTKKPPRCTALISSSNSGSNTAALPELGQIAVVTGTDVAGSFKIKIHNRMVFAKDPKAKALYRNCENLYLDALDQLLLAPELLQKRAYKEVVAAAGVVATGVRGCAAAVVKHLELKLLNDDVGLLADAIVVIAKKLSA